MTIAIQTEKYPELQPLGQTLRTGRAFKELGYQNNELTLQDNVILKGTRTRNNQISTPVGINRTKHSIHWNS